MARVAGKDGQMMEFVLGAVAGVLFGLTVYCCAAAAKDPFEHVEEKREYKVIIMGDGTYLCERCGASLNPYDRECRACGATLTGRRWAE